MKKIIISKSAKNSDELYDVVISNIEFINEAHRRNLTNEDLNYDSLCSYFVDVMDENVLYDGFKGFLFKSRNKNIIKKYIKDGLKMLGLKEHEAIFDEYLDMIKQYDDIDIYDLEGNVDLNFHALDEKYRKLDSQNLEIVNAKFLLNHPDTIILDSKDKIKYIDDLIADLGEEAYQQRKQNFLKMQPGYVKDVNFLCDFLNEELDAIYLANLNRFQYESHLHIYFKTKSQKSYCYIDLGFEIVLLNDDDEEIRRFSRKKHTNL
ncbi:hypothetical protein OKW23_000625 [Bacilli bacterium PM5-9]|nr:hypothetical protein [Bacilli bacterium PM5-9]